jgi:tetratricopeptide (TPR) repeat protein
MTGRLRRPAGPPPRSHPGNRPFLVGWLALALAAAPPGRAHPDTWHAIELISAQISTGDHRAPLFYARGTEYRTVEKWVEAEADLRECLRQDPGFFLAQKDLASVLLAAGRTEDAAAAAREAVRLATGRPAASQASAWAEVARVERARGAWSAVLAATDEALRLVPRGEVDWYLLREEAFRGQGRLDAAIEDLARGDTRLRSTLLRSAWLDALLEAGRAAETLAPIEAALAETRHQAPWLIRRARARASQGDLAAAQADWTTALAELESRLVPEDPDPTLLVQKGLALAGLGRRGDAAAALAAARAILPEPTLLAPLARALAHPQ